MMFKKKPSPETADAAAGDRSRRRTLRLAGLAALGVVLVLGAGTAAFLTVPGLRSLWAAEETELAAEDTEPGADLVVMPFEQMIVNLSGATGSELQRNRYMRLDLALVYDQARDTAGQVGTRHLYMRDAFQDYLRQLTDRDIEGSLGLAVVKSELLRRARAIAGNEAPHEILVMELVVQ